MATIFLRPRFFWRLTSARFFNRIISMRGFTVLLTTGFFIGCASTRPLPFEERPLAAVMPFAYTAQPQEFAGSVSGLADSLAGALVRTGRLRLVERQRVETVLQEVRQGMSGAVDSATAAKIGRQLGAEAVVIGAVVSVAVLDESRSMKFAEKADRWVEVVVEARMVAVETGELIAAAKAVGKAKSAQRQAFGGQLGELARPEALVQKALQDIGEKHARELSRNVPPRSKLKT